MTPERTSIAIQLLCCAVLCIVIPSESRAQTSPEYTRSVLVLGRVSDDPRHHADKMQPILDYVVPRMRDVGIREGRILMARDAVQMQSYLRRRRVDWISDTATMAIEYERRAGATLLLATERGGSDYRSVFFTWRGSGITSLSELKGHSIALQSTYSTSSYVLPSAELLRAGIGMDLLLSPLDRPVPGRVGYVFARTEGNIQAWVRKRLVDAGAFSNLDWEKLRASMPESAADLVVFHETRAVPRGVEVVAPGLAPEVRERLREVLLNAGSDPTAQEALRAFFDTQSFVPIDAHVRGGLKSLSDDMALIRSHLE